MKMKKILIDTALMALGLSATAAYATTFSLAGDFSTASNPNGVWSYGYITPSTGAFTAYTGNGNPAFGPLPSWYSPSLGIDPVLAVNNTTSTYTFSTLTVLPGWAVFHPGPNDQQSDFRFTAPAGGNYAFNLSFQGADSVGPTSTQVLITSGGNTYYSQAINSFETPFAFNGTLALTAGQVVDIKVDDSGNYLFDSTMLRGTITSAAMAPVPEPATGTLFALGLAVTGLMLRKKAASAN
jgi:hypothetical protein